MHAQPNKKGPKNAQPSYSGGPIDVNGNPAVVTGRVRDSLGGSFRAGRTAVFSEERGVGRLDLASRLGNRGSGPQNPVPISNRGEDTAITPDGNFVVVCDGGNLQPVSVIDIATQTEISTFNLGSDCNSVDVCDDGSVLVTSFNTNVVRRLTIDCAGTLTDTGESLASPRPNNVYCAPGSSSGYVVRLGSGEILSFTIPGLGAVDTRGLSGDFGLTGLINRAGDRVFVRSIVGGPSVDVFAYNSATGALGAAPVLTIPVADTTSAFGMEQMALSPDETRLYVPRADAVDVFNPATGALLSPIVDANIVFPRGVCCSNQPAGRVSTAKKGSLLVFSKIEVKWDAAGNVTQDTFLDLTNDFPRDVVVQLYFINGDVPLEKVEVGNPPVTVERAHPGWNWVDCQIMLTKDQPTYWSALTGSNSQGGVCQPFTVLDPGNSPGRPDRDGPPGSRVLRGYAYAWAVNNAGEEIRWNHLKGDVAIVNYQHATAWEYNTYAFQSKLAEHGAPTDGVPGRLLLDGIEYDQCFDKLLLDFYASGSDALSNGGATVQVDTDLTLFPVSADLRQDTRGPVHTKAVFDIWNQNEVRFSGTHRCISCWDQTLLSKYTDGQPGFPANHFLRGNLQTDKGKSRIDGESSNVCEADTGRCEEFRECLCHDDFFFCRHEHFDEDGLDFDCTVETPLLGVSAKILAFSGAASGVAYAGMNLVGQGLESTTIWHDIIEGPDELIIGPSDGAPIEADVADNPRINRTPAGASKRGR